VFGNAALPGDTPTEEEEEVEEVGRTSQCTEENADVIEKSHLGPTPPGEGRNADVGW
jgi:hypothetical protein